MSSATGSRPTPRVFVTYAHDSEQHKDDTLLLAHLLVENGVDVELDQWAAGRRQDWSTWAIRAMTEADFVVVVASPAYRAAGDGLGRADVNRGVQSEAAVLRDLLHHDRATWVPKLLPVLLPGHDPSEIPHFLQPNVNDHYPVKEITRSGIDDLLRVITDQPARRRPALGLLPDLPPHPDPVLAAPLAPTPLTSAPPVEWRQITRGFQSMPCLELHLVPVGVHPRIQVRKLVGLPNELAALGRARGLLDVAGRLTVDATDEVATVASSEANPSAGLAVFRAGQRSAWQALPAGTLGPVLIQDEVTASVTDLIRALLEVDVPLADAYAPALGLNPLSMSRIGTRADLAASSARVHSFRTEEIHVQPEDAYPPSLLRDDAADIADELTTRLVAAFHRSYY